MTPIRLNELCMTYSIVARDPASGQLGVAVQTHQVGVGRVVPWMLPGVGAMATQSLSNVSFGPAALTLLREGVAAEKVVESLAASDTNAHRRQFAVVDARGGAAAYTGSGCIREAGHHVGDGYTVQANMMTHPTVIAAMRRAFESASGDLAAKMIAAMQAAQKEDGDIRGMQSAALKIVSGDIAARAWESEYDLRVDEHEQPVTELARLVRLRSAQLLDREGYAHLDAGSVDKALTTWKKARDKAPELEELAFWQAITLADSNPTSEAVSIAGRILRMAMENEPRREQWIDLILRLQECGLITRPNAGQELITALTEA